MPGIGWLDHSNYYPRHGVGYSSPASLARNSQGPQLTRGVMGVMGAMGKKSHEGTRIAIHLLQLTTSTTSPPKREEPQELHDMQYAVLSHRKYRYSSFSLYPPTPPLKCRSHRTPKRQNSIPNNQVPILPRSMSAKFAQKQTPLAACSRSEK